MHVLIRGLVLEPLDSRTHLGLALAGVGLAPLAPEYTPGSAQGTSGGKPRLVQLPALRKLMVQRMEHRVRLGASEAAKGRMRATAQLLHCGLCR